MNPLVHFYQLNRILKAAAVANGAKVIASTSIPARK